MADIKLFQLQSESVRVIRTPNRSTSNNSLQSLMERNLESFLGVRFLATEYPTGKEHGGRIDTLGLDDNNCPVIIEYKRALNENVINQGLYYLNWLMNQPASFELLVLRKLGSEWSEKIDWSGPRLLCIAVDFTRYDEQAVRQISRNDELLRYRRYGEDLLLLELLWANTAVSNKKHSHAIEVVKEKQFAGGTTEMTSVSKALQDVWESLKAFLLALGDDVHMIELEQYVAFRRRKNFACVRVQRRDLFSLDAAGSVNRIAGGRIHARCSGDRPRRNRRSGNPDTDRRRFDKSPAASAAQLSRCDRTPRKRTPAGLGSRRARLLCQPEERIQSPLICHYLRANRRLIATCSPAQISYTTGFARCRAPSDQCADRGNHRARSFENEALY